jgi:hypothetical protein
MDMKIPKLSTRAAVQPSTFNDSQRTVELTWTTGATVRRFDWWDGPYMEELSMDPANIRMDRLNNGAPLLANHDSTDINSVIGVVERAWLEGNEGRALVRFSDREDVAPIISDVKSGILRNISVGYAVYEYDVTKPTDGGMPTYRATDWEPMEVSIVPVPADASAQIRSSTELHSVSITKRSPAMADPNENEVPVTEAPVSETPVAPDAEQIRSQVRAQELSRISAIRDATRKAKLGDDFADKLIASAKTVDEARSEIWDAWSAKADASATTSHIQMGETAEDKALRGAEEALLVRAGIVKHEDAKGNEFLGLRMSDFARLSLERNGESTRGLSYDGMAGMALRANTTSDFPVLLENTMHKIVLAAYNTAPDTWRQFCKIGSVSDFRAWKRLRTGTIANLSDVNEHGELTNLNIPDATAESVQASRKGNIISITPETIINDDFNWIADQSSALGRAAARTIEAAVYAKLIANPNMSDGNALMSSAHGNLAGSGAVISVASLDAARVAMASQMDISGNDYLEIRPSVLLCPISMGGLARVTTNSQYDPDSAARLLVPNKINGLVNTIIDTPRLSGTAWYLISAPSDAPVFEVVFLDGNQNPRIAQEECFRTKGLSWSVELPFGVGVIDYKGIYKQPGA